jgi:nucleoside-diphosphate-sugar epimerase
MRFDLVINLFIAQAIKEGKITVNGGNQIRPFLHVSDAADSLIFSMEKNLTGTYNIISENMTIMQAAEKIKKLTSCEISINDDDLDDRNYNVSGAKINQIGFNPKKNIDFAYDEIKNALNDGSVSNYKDNKYNNYKLLFDSKELQEKVFIQGIPGSLDVP